MNLRPYQRQTMDAVKSDWRNGINSVMVTMATGGGKTIVFLGILAEELHSNPDKRCLILAHRKELIEQPIERLAAFWPELAQRSGIVMADQDDCHQQIIVATVQTLNGNGRLARILQHGPIDYIVSDEAHHSCSASYLAVYEALRSANPNLKHLGVTATPIRADGKKFGEIYEKVSAHYGIKELVKLGYLAPPRWLAIQTGISLAGVPKTGIGEERDYNSQKLADVFETENCFELVVESHKKYAHARPAIAFTASVAGAYKLADKFNSQGISAAAADGTTRKDVRSQLIKDFRSGKISVLCNVALWTEGLDLPEISCIHMVRPTQSDSYYMQCIGRGLRLLPGKEDALILDYAPAEVRNVTMMGDVLGVDIDKGAYMEENAEEGAVIAGFTYDGDLKWLSGDPMEIIGRALDYLNLSPWKWTQPTKHAWMVLGLGKNENDGIERTLAISPAGETMQLWAIWKREEERWHSARLLNEGAFEALSEIADELAAKHGSVQLARKSQRWHRDAPTEGQIKFARRLGIDCAGLTKGTVAEAITYKLTMNALRRGGAHV